MEPIRLEINGTLDLHTFNPKEIKELIPDYLLACLEKEIHLVRIIHGKGTGSLRRTVHALLAREACVSSYRLADESAGSWGATMVVLRPQNKGI
jgi:DNA-nicking Smr family endonuclease